MSNNKQETIVYNANQRPITSIASSAVAITPSDTTILAPGSIYVGVGGDVALVLQDSAAVVTFVGVPAGAILPVLATQVYATGTDATDMILLR